jgi:predicted amidohydrolase
MKIAVAQIKPVKGDIQKNIEIHKNWIMQATAENADFIAFPELSLTGYEPALAKELAICRNDPRLGEFQQISDRNNISIGIGAPTKLANGILISMLIFQPSKPLEIYSKQILHSDELRYFIEAKEQLILTIEHKKIAPAICYESLQRAHLINARAVGAELYVASIAKSQAGIEKAYTHYAHMAKEFSIPILVSNALGHCDNFFSAGQSAIWNEKGQVLAKLGSEKEGLLLWDTETNSVVIKA